MIMMSLTIDYLVIKVESELGTSMLWDSSTVVFMKSELVVTVLTTN